MRLPTYQWRDQDFYSREGIWGGLSIFCKFSISNNKNAVTTNCMRLSGIEIPNQQIYHFFLEIRSEIENKSKEINVKKLIFDKNRK